MDKNLHNPGTDNLPSGEYREVGPRGGEVPHARHVSIDPGDRLPPTQEKGHKWEKLQNFKAASCPASLYDKIFLLLKQKHLLNMFI